LRVVSLNAKKCLSDWHKFGAVFFMLIYLKPTPELLTRKNPKILAVHKKGEHNIS